MSGQPQRIETTADYFESNRHDPTQTRHTDGQRIVDTYLRWLELDRRSSPETLKSYRSVLKAWLHHTNGQLLQADRTTMADFARRPTRAGNPRAARSSRRDVAVLRSFYKWCHIERLTARELAGNLAAPKVGETLPKPIPDDVWGDVWCQEMSPIKRTVLGLGYYVGLRRAEISRITGNQIDHEYIRAFMRKGSVEHTVPWLSMVETVRSRLAVVHRTRWVDMFVDDLTEIASLVGPHPLLSVWAQNPTPQTVNRKLADMPFTPHQLRHSCATNLVARCGVPPHIAQKLLNHTSIQMTMGYVKVENSALADWLSTT